ncbi:MAG: RNA 2',3'-cyclic phosphodiesterase [Desulfuromonadales bacterium]|nr:RNA 2',3'-cyclic phosphodiesterase [Desulfuromonadales bacterium]
MRTFIAVELSSALKQYLGDIARQLRRCDVTAGWVKPDNLHLTLKFLGEVDDTRLPQLAEKISQLARDQGAFTANLNGFGFFPSSKQPRILYAAINEPLPFKQLVQQIDRLFEPLGFAPEQHFHPHITLARIKSNNNLERLRQLMDDIPLRQAFTVNAVSLFGSILHSDGVRYHVLQRGLLSETTRQPSIS